jgi:hypothetical protein
MKPYLSAIPEAVPVSVGLFSARGRQAEGVLVITELITTQASHSRPPHVHASPYLRLD